MRIKTSSSQTTKKNSNKTSQQLVQDSKTKIQDEDPNWRPTKYRIENGKKILILGKYEMTAEEFIAMAKSVMSQEEIDKVESGNCECPPDEMPQKID